MDDPVQRSTLAARGQVAPAARAATSPRFHLDYAAWHARIAGFASKPAPARAVSEKNAPTLQPSRAADAEWVGQRAA